MTTQEIEQLCIQEDIHADAYVEPDLTGFYVAGTVRSHRCSKTNNRYQNSPKYYCMDCDCEYFVDLPCTLHLPF